MVGLAILTAIVVVLQLLGSFIKFGPFTISLVLIPIVVGAALYGPRGGAFLGFVFGVIVLIAVITGADQGGFILWSANWFLTALTCLGKGILAGLLAGVVYRAFEKKNTVFATVLAAITAPVVNTGIFLICMNLFFHKILVEWAGGSNVVYYMIVGLVGVNFLIELGISIILSPAIVTIIKSRKKA